MKSLNFNLQKTRLYSRRSVVSSGQPLPLQDIPRLSIACLVSFQTYCSHPQTKINKPKITPGAVSTFWSFTCTWQWFQHPLKQECVYLKDKFIHSSFTDDRKSHPKQGAERSWRERGKNNTRREILIILLNPLPWQLFPVLLQCGETLTFSPGIRFGKARISFLKRIYFSLSDNNKWKSCHFPHICVASSPYRILELQL